MAFSLKTWVDRISEYPTRRTLTKEDGSTELVTVTREEGTVSQEGDAFNAETMNDLETRISNEFASLNTSLGTINTSLGTINTSLSTTNTNLGKKAPTSHASTETTYGVGSTTKYGHCKTINNLTSSAYVAGESLSAYQGAVLNKSLASKVDTSDSRLSDARTPKSHTHDDRYYTETEIDKKVSTLNTAIGKKASLGTCGSFTTVGGSTYYLPTRDNKNVVSFKWTGSQLQIYIDNTLVYTL